MLPELRIKKRVNIHKIKKVIIIRTLEVSEHQKEKHTKICFHNLFYIKKIFYNVIELNLNL